MYVKALQNCIRSYFLRFYVVNCCSSGVPLSIWTFSFAAFWPSRIMVPLWKGLIYTDTHEKAQGCAGGFWVLYGILNHPNFTSWTGKWVIWSALHCILKIFKIQFSLKVAYQTYAECITHVNIRSNFSKIDQLIVLTVAVPIERQHSIKT